MPKRESVVSGRSKCPNCGNTITTIENIPLVSWLLQRGKCRHCGQKISARYPLIELACGILFALAVIEFEVSLTAVAFAAFYWVLVVLSVIDLEYKLLPDRIVFPALGVGWLLLVAAAVDRGDAGEVSGTFVFGAAIALAIFAVLFPWPWVKPVEEAAEESRAAAVAYLVAGIVLFVAWIALLFLSVGSGQSSLTGAAIGAAIFSGFLFALTLVYPAGMGMGDVKLALVLGTFLGFLGIPGVVLVGMFLSVIIAGVVGMTWTLIKRGGRKMQIPFGPFLALGTVIATFVGSDIAEAYLRNLG